MARHNDALVEDVLSEAILFWTYCCTDDTGTCTLQFPAAITSKRSV